MSDSEDQTPESHIPARFSAEPQVAYNEGCHKIQARARKALMGRLDHTLRRLGPSLALVALSSVAAGADQPGCLMHSLGSLAPPAAVAESSAAPGFKLFQLEQDRNDTSLRFECDGQRLASLSLELLSGQTRTVILVAESGVSFPLVSSAASLAATHEQHGTWQITSQALRVGDDGGMIALSLAAHQATAVQLIEISVAADPANRPGQRQELNLVGSAVTADPDATLLLILESRGDERMFRDQFQVDPRAGQFSLRNPSPRRDDQAADAMSGAASQ